MAGGPLNNLLTRLVVGLIVVTCLCTANGQLAKQAPLSPGIVYRNPRVYNVDCSVELSPDPNNIDRSKDLKLWVPIPREWDSQKAVKIVSVQPEPHARYVDPEYGNPMLFWDFGKTPEQATYTVNIRLRLESCDVSVKVDPNRVGSYDKTSKEYTLYTRSTHTIHITPKIKEMAQEAIGDETNPYLQAERIVKFVRKKVRYKILDFERGRGIDVLLAYPVKDEKTGQEYYEGCCSQYTALMVALCRAVGIPARSVSAYIGWVPWVGPDGVKPKYAFETKVSPEGLAATQLHGGLGCHMWGEFLIPNYGWIPIDLTANEMGHRNNYRWIQWKGRDIQIGPDAPPEDSEGYGANWVALHHGRADSPFYAVLNIAKIHTSKVTILHHSDPFPADELAVYPGNVLPSENAEKDLRQWRQGVLNLFLRFARRSVPDHVNLGQFYKENPRTKEAVEAFACHMLRRQMGDERFFKLADAYVNLRQESGAAVPTRRFQELAEAVYGAPLDWFFNQWVNSTELPRLKLENVVVRKDREGWRVQGQLVQSGNTIFRLPTTLAVDTRKGRERLKLWVEKKTVEFDFHTSEEPRKLTVDPDYEVLKVQRMAPRLEWFWDAYPQFAVVYGTSGETQANKMAAERFVGDYLGLGREIIKADTDMNDADLKSKCVLLVGRPETNRVAQRFTDSFPIKLNGARFAWQGTTYDKPTQGVAQVIESPTNAEGLMVMYAGLSPEALLKLCDLELYDPDCSYVIFDGDKQSATGDWEDVDPGLYWSSSSHPPLGSEPSQAH